MKLLLLVMTSVFNFLRKNSKKGEKATILVIGGSRMYTGAVAFSAIGAFRAGAEIVYIMTDACALCPLKIIYDAIVVPFTYDERILHKVTACVIGPGLGRTATSDDLALIQKILRFLNAAEVPVIIDGDGIHYYKVGLFSSISKCVLTPNYKEALGLKPFKGHICICKGKEDIIGNKEIVVSEEGSAKRCGGQGDILTGIISVALSLSKKADYNKACAQGCIIMRRASRRSFNRLGYSMIASDILEDLPYVLREEISGKEECP